MSSNASELNSARLTAVWLAALVALDRARSARFAAIAKLARANADAQRATDVAITALTTLREERADAFAAIRSAEDALRSADRVALDARLVAGLADENVNRTARGANQSN